jgi:hypothetical protein
MCQRPGQRRTQVVVLDVEARRHDIDGTRRHLRVASLGELDIPSAVPAADFRLLARGVQPFQAVLPHRLEQPVAGNAITGLGDNKRRVDKPRKGAEHMPAVRAHALDRLERERPGKDRQPPEQHPLVVGEQVVAPLQGGGQSLLASDRRAITATE